PTEVPQAPRSNKTRPDLTQRSRIRQPSKKGEDLQDLQTKRNE
ncbi:5589_t:CDS:1, partial [Gigaspora margarita]